MTTKSPAQILREARALIEDPEHWTQGEFARSAKGRQVEILSKKAVCFCAMGANYRVAGINPEIGPSPDGIRDANRFLERVVGPVVNFNDVSSHREVLNAFDRAIELAEGCK